jgi:DNA-binding transcriptional LysR family regulator
MMNLQHGRLLVAIAESGNISHAATCVNITQSGASQAIALLERNVGFPVFMRKRQHIGITALAQAVVEHACIILEQPEPIHRLSDSSWGLHGTRVRLATFPSSYGTAILPAEAG